MIKEEGASFEDETALAVVDGRGFLTEDQMFSTPDFMGGKGVINYYSINVRLDINNFMIRANKLWDEFDIYFPYDLSDAKERNFLTSHRNLSFI